MASQAVRDQFQLNRIARQARKRDAYVASADKVRAAAKVRASKASVNQKIDKDKWRKADLMSRDADAMTRKLGAWGGDSRLSRPTNEQKRAAAMLHLNTARAFREAGDERHAESYKKQSLYHLKDAGGSEDEQPRGPDGRWI